MSLEPLEPAELRRRCDPAALGFAGGGVDAPHSGSLGDRDRVDRIGQIGDHLAGLGPVAIELAQP